jgi:hypothetical protein
VSILPLIEGRFADRAFVVLRKFIEVMGVEVDLYADDPDEYSDTYGISSGADTGFLGTAKGLLFNYSMDPIGPYNTTQFEGGFIHFIDPIFDNATTCVYPKQEVADATSGLNGGGLNKYKLEFVSAPGTVRALYQKRRLTSIPN